MSQISPPIRIVAVAAVVLIALYMAVLRPKSSSTPTAAATPAATPAGNIHTGKPAVTSLGRAVQKAQGAANATEQQMQNEAHNAGAPDTNSSDSQPAAKSGSAVKSQPAPGNGSAAAKHTPAVDLAGLPRPVAHAVRHHEVLALLFWNGHSADDRAVHRALRQVPHFDGTVYTRTVPIRAMSRYARITRGADVQQTPTVVVVDRKLHATTLVGYVDADTISQSVVDALQATGGIFNDHYLARINGVCSSNYRALAAIPHPQSVAQARHGIRGFVARSDRFFSDFAAVSAPKKWRGLRRASLADLRVVKASNHRLMHSLTGGHATLASLRGDLVSEDGSTSPAIKRFDHRMDRHDVIFCGAQG